MKNKEGIDYNSNISLWKTDDLDNLKKLSKTSFKQFDMALQLYNSNPM